MAEQLTLTDEQKQQLAAANINWAELVKILALLKQYGPIVLQIIIDLLSKKPAVGTMAPSNEDGVVLECAAAIQAALDPAAHCGGECRGHLVKALVYASLIE